MTLSTLPPWFWGVGGILSVALFFWVQPWRAHWLHAARTLRRYPSLALIPLVIAVAAHLSGDRPPTASSLGFAEILRTSLSSGAAALTGGCASSLVAIALGAGLLVNAFGIKTGLFRSLHAFFAAPYGRLFGLTLLASVTATLLLPALNLGPARHSLPAQFVTAFADLWVAVAHVACFAWLTLRCEAVLRAPEKSTKVLWFETAAFYLTRLWPLILFTWVTLIARPWLPALGREISTGLMAFFMAWGSLACLHTKSWTERGAATIAALQRLLRHPAAFLLWLATATVFLALFHLASVSIRHAASVAQQPWAGPISLFLTAVHALLVTWSLAAWIGIQVDRLPFSTKPPRPRRRAGP
jgi:hypothetical protein